MPGTSPGMTKSGEWWAMEGLMKGKRGLIMGIANDHSIAWGMAKTLHAHGAELVGERLDPAAEGVALIGEGHLGAESRQRPGDAPGNRMIIGDAHDQPALALHQVLHCRNAFFFVMPGLVPGIRVFLTSLVLKTWMAGTSPAMTVN